ncbi:dephospho-CoA kinase [Heyndrickxia acidicola]|uniref:Dephospho-CoA kinase n=1 Tax=Heyndrickxia acidicola TaxID=209389 RepID=A0ABU6MFN0_9BACI|nr:dephospho-CoA kinase [Heyndrickxia acidicola]MED1203223.1 dephospho-CoA kinase [Heyndrickxia acidicola]
MASIIGLTGGIASGKSTVAKMLIEKGFIVVDADLAARKVVEKGETAYYQIVREFGESILNEDKSINRTALGDIIFNHNDKRLLLNSFVHPAVRAYMNKEKNAAIADGRHTIFLDIPLLFESKLMSMVEKTILVFVDEDVQLERLMLRNQLSEQDARARISSQMPLREKILLADAVINNNGSLVETEKQLNSYIHEWKLIP